VLQLPVPALRFLDLCPRVAQRHRPIEHEPFIGGIGIDAEIAESFELVSGARGRARQRRLDAARRQRLQRARIQVGREIRTFLYVVRVFLCEEVMVQAYRTLGLKVYARMDGFVVDGEVIVTEPNTLPGMTPSTCIFHEAAEVGIGPMEFVGRIIELSLEAHARKKGPLA